IAYDGGRVFALNYDGLLQAVDARTGAGEWATDLPGQYSFTSPPTARGGIVYTAGAGSGGTMYGVDEDTGRLLWSRGASGGAHSSPAIAGTAVYVSFACSQIYAFDRTSGDNRWAVSGRCTGGDGATAVYHRGRVYARERTTALVVDAASGAVLDA